MRCAPVLHTSLKNIFKMKLLTILTFSACVLMASCQDVLGPMNVIRDKITLSGFSSGGSMAQMLQFSYSSLFSGIAVFSHTFLRCGRPNGVIDDWDRNCTILFNATDADMYDPALVHNDIREYFMKGYIEDPNNLKGKRLYVYTGLRSALFTPRQSLNILKVYEPYIQSPASIMTRVQDSVQLLPSNNYGGPCNQSVETTEFIGNCGFSGVTEALNFLLFDNYDQSEAFKIDLLTMRGNLSTFNQTEFTTNLTNHNMDDIGFYYIPKQCQSKMMSCYLHFYFHGCLTGREFNGPRHIENSGLLEMAERKGIIMVFPQARSSLPNPIGCWDTFGVAGQYFATQQGPQVTAIKRMLDRILEMRSMPMMPVMPAPVVSSRLTEPLTMSTNNTATTRSFKKMNLWNGSLGGSGRIVYLPPPLMPTERTLPKRASLSSYRRFRQSIK